MWDIPSWLVTMNNLKPLLTGAGTAFLYTAFALSVISQIAVFMFGVYKVRQMFREAED